MERGEQNAITSLAPSQEEEGKSKNGELITGKKGAAGSCMKGGLQSFWKPPASWEAQVSWGSAGREIGGKFSWAEILRYPGGDGALGPLQSSLVHH